MKEEMSGLSESAPVSPGRSHAEFPYDLLGLLRCSHDGGQLVLVADLRSGSFGLIDGVLRCETCAAEYRVADGIACMMVGNLADEDKHEIVLRDFEYAEMLEEPAESFVAPQFGWRSQLSDILEVPPHLAGLRPLESRKVVEIGCGDGRFTILMAQLGAQVLAVDFSVNALRKLATRLPSGTAPTTYRVSRPVRTGDLRGQVGLVQADASQFCVAPRSFDRALSATPLDTREQRMAMFRAIANALRDDGRYIASFEHDELPRRLLGEPLARRYSPSTHSPKGIFIEHFPADTIRRELTPFFLQLNVQRIRPRVPFVHRLPVWLGARISLAWTALPILRECGEIISVKCQQPVRPPVEGEIRRGSRVVKALFSWYKRLRQDSHSSETVA